MRFLWVSAAAWFVSCANCTGVISDVAVGNDVRCDQAATTTSTPGATWTPIGLAGGEVSSVLSLGQQAVLIGLRESTGLYAVRRAGLFRSEDLGNNVVRVDSVPAQSVVRLVRAANTVFVALERVEATDGGAQAAVVWASSDQGQTFNATSDGLPVGSLVDLWAAGDSLFAIVASGEGERDVGLYRRAVQQGPWVRVRPPGLESAPEWLRAGAAHPSQPNALYVASDSHLFASHDLGANFTQVPAPAFGQVRSLRVTDDGRVWVSSHQGLQSTNDDGQTWRVDISDSPVNAIENHGVIAATGSGLSIVGQGALDSVGHCLANDEVLSVERSVDEPSVVLVGTKAGLWVSSDEGRTMHAAGAGLDALGAQPKVTKLGDETVLMLLSSDGVFSYRPNTQQWRRELTLPGMVDVSPSTDEELLLAGSRGLWVWNFKSATASQVTGVGEASAVKSRTGGLLVYQRGPSTAAVLTGASASLNNLSVTSLVGRELTGSSMFRSDPLAIAPQGTIYAGVRNTDGTATLLRSDDLGTTSTAVWHSDDWVAHGVYVDDEGAVFLTGWQQNVGLRKSGDRGQTFEVVDHADAGLNDLAHLVYSVAFDGRGGLVVGTQIGVYVATNGRDFVALNDGLNEVSAVYGVQVLEAAGQRVLIARTSSGVYWRVWQ